MFSNFMAKIVFKKLLSRPDISKAYALTDPSDSWYPTLKKVHESLAEIQKLTHQTADITSFDGYKLKAICYPAQNAKGTVVCIHGYTSHAEREWAFPGLFYLSQGFNVVIPYQRAHGLSEGKFITFGALEKRDMVLWLKKINQMYPSSPVVVHGLSMGGGIALQLCDVENPTLKGIVADAPSLNINYLFNDVAHGVCKNNKKSAQKLFEALKKLFEKKFGVQTDITDAEQYVAKSRYPLLFAAGSCENRQKGFEHLAEICPQQTRTVILPGCNHGNGMYKQTEMFQGALAQFLKDTVG